MGAAVGTIGLAAEIADGDILEDPAKAAGQIGLAYGAGRAIGGNVVAGASNVYNSVEKTIETYKKGAYGEEKYNNMKFDKEFFKSSGYNQIVQDQTLLNTYGGAEGIKVATQEFLENGITDATEIRTALQNGVTGDRYKDLKSAGIDNAKQMGKIQKSSKLKALTGAQIRHRKIIADAAKSMNLDDEGFENLCIRFGMKNSRDIAELKDSLAEYWLL